MNDDSENPPTSGGTIDDGGIAVVPADGDSVRAGEEAVLLTEGGGLGDVWRRTRAGETRMRYASPGVRNDPTSSGPTTESPGYCSMGTSPGHRRMPINDDEIENRCLACQRLVGDLTVVTYDTGQSTRARAAGLKVNKLSQPLGEEPDA